MNQNGEIPIHNRLPSYNVSFQSATIYTIPEIHDTIMIHIQKSSSAYDCSKNTTSKSVFMKHGHDVRVTGVVLYTDIKREFIIVGDALHDKPCKGMGSTTISTTRDNNNDNNNSCTKRNSNRDINSKSVVPSTATGTTSTSASSASTTSTNTTFSGKKRKLITVKTNHYSNNSLLLNRIQQKQQQNNNKKFIYHSPNISLQQLSSSSSLPPSTTSSSKSLILEPNLIKSIQTHIKHEMKMILIDFTNGKNDIVWKDDDLIMVIGTIQFTNTMMENNIKSNANVNEHDDSDNDRNNYIHAVMNYIYTHDNHVTNINNSNNNKNGGYIDARIITNVNGTDVNLLQEGLRLRREYLQRFSLGLYE